MPDLSLRAIFQPTVLLALALMAVIAMMILPMPPVILDIGLAASFALAILMFTVTLFIERPLDFSAFPTVLLASLMLRLSLNVSSTKLIIANGHTGTAAAGDVIEGFAMFVMGGSIVLGLVVFGVLLIVNFIVINKGATRMAEVGARFALDAMPGKQLAIDADMAAGAIDHAEAKRRRETEQAETTFFGSLDGASKFVKGDAVAGLLITALNLVVGLIVGSMLHDMPLGRAFETYAILTVGDGLVSQIPAVVISIASALLLARGGATGATDLALVAQLGRHPAALATVGGLLALFALLPGLPFVPFMLGAAGLAAIAWRSWRTREASRAAEARARRSDTAPEAAQRASMGDMLDVDDIHLEFSPDLVEMVLDPGTGLDARIENMRAHVARTYGIILPEIRLTDDPGLGPGQYRVKILGVEQARDTLRPDRVLALLAAPDRGDPPEGEDVSEPVYGAPARWIAPAEQETASLSGLTIVQPAEVLATHLLEIIRRNLSRLLSFKSLRKILDEMTQLSDTRRAEANRRMIDEMIPDKVPLDMLLAVLRLLLDELVSIRNLPLILEAIAEGRQMYPTADGVTEHVRQRLGFQLVADLKRPDGTIPLLQLAPEWEETFTAHQLGPAEKGGDVALPPDAFNRLAGGIADRLEKAAAQGIAPALVTSMRRRRFLRTVMSAKGIPAPVLSFEEIGVEARPALVGLVPA
ncbi:flagellar biosynthesis protein FlhA [Wenxinia saemankumensis]|uniref:Flagellar biosynthesis protein FlhA n=1 Tax=Wenxinia saemankumensis TaxID=1447782 RepID=A0A1M6G6Y5_9RHOB|nr:flagellar biosynthesis protein FlhA [Wenxinia saemankumensis]SHJ05557.1 flagellar biosynthesis protein FlhA [Wenxinia saemankumensis]